MTFSEKSFDPINPSLVRNSIKTQEGWGEKLTVRKENLEGYSFNVSNHIAYENGIRPDSSLRVPVNTEPSWEGEASIIWRIKSVNPTTDVGRLSKLLARDFLLGDDIIIVPTPTEVSVFKPDQLDGSDISNYPSEGLKNEKFEVTIKDF